MISSLDQSTIRLKNNELASFVLLRLPIFHVAFAHIQFSFLRLIQAIHRYINEENLIINQATSPGYFWADGPLMLALNHCHVMHINDIPLLLLAHVEVLPRAVAYFPTNYMLDSPPLQFEQELGSSLIQAPSMPVPNLACHLRTQAVAEEGEGRVFILWNSKLMTLFQEFGETLLLQEQAGVRGPPCKERFLGINFMMSMKYCDVMELLGIVFEARVIYDPTNFSTLWPKQCNDIFNGVNICHINDVGRLVRKMLWREEIPQNNVTPFPTFRTSTPAEIMQFSPITRPPTPYPFEEISIINSTENNVSTESNSTPVARPKPTLFSERRGKTARKTLFLDLSNCKGRETLV